MPLSICFDALGTCFTTEALVEALDQVMGEQLKPVGGARMIVMDWFHSAQRDYTYASITSPPPPPIAQILKTTLPRSIAYALQSKPSLTDSPTPDLTPVYQKLTALTPAPGLAEAFKLLSEKGKVFIVTNGAQKTTEGYVSQAGLEKYVEAVKSCDEVGLGKPFPEVYTMANKTLDAFGEKGEGGRWFVAAHSWDLHAAKKAGFKTGLVLAEQPPVKDGEVEQSWWDIYGGKPDIIGADLAEVARSILAAGQ